MPPARKLVDLPYDQTFVREACHFAKVWDVNGELDAILRSFTDEADQRGYTPSQCLQILTEHLTEFSEAPSASFATAVENISTQVLEFADEQDITTVRMTVTDVAVAVYARHLLEAIFEGGMLERD